MAARLGEWRRKRLSERQLRRYRYEGRVPYLKVGGTVLYDPDEMRAWLEAQRVPAKQQAPA
jgi:hypothetical protein